VFENRVLRRIFRLMKEEAVENWRKLHNGEVRKLYASPYMFIIRVIKFKEDEMVVACSTHGIDEKCIQNFGKPGGKRPLGRQTCR
jgi:hypothetical protein